MRANIVYKKIFVYLQKYPLEKIFVLSVNWG